MRESETQGLERDPPAESSNATKSTSDNDQNSLRTTATVDHVQDDGVFAVETISIHVYDQTLTTEDPELTATYHLEGTTAVLDTITTRPAVDETTFRPTDHLPLVTAADSHVTALSMVQAVYGFSDHVTDDATIGGEQNA